MAKTPRVAIFLDPSRAYDQGLLRGIAQYVNLHGSWDIFRPATFYERFSGLAGQNLAELRRCRLNAIITNDTPSTRRLVELGIPLIVVPGERKFPGAIHLQGDNRGVAAMAAEHLREIGLRQFGYVGFDCAQWSLERAEAFRRRVAEMGYSSHMHLIPLSPREDEKKRHRAQLVKWLKLLPKPVGIMACNDDFARTISELCRLHDLRIAEEIALIGIDNDELVCELSNPSITSVAFATEQAGYEAAARLDQIMHGKKVGNDAIPVLARQIVIRASTNILAIDDEEVVKALRFIQGNTHRIIRVGEVAEATLLSQWTLNQSFQRILGHSILKEVNRQRARHVARLLSETDLPVERIARDLGYESQAHLARYFRREMGMTPRAYRTLHPTRSRPMDFHDLP